MLNNPAILEKHTQPAAIAKDDISREKMLKEVEAGFKSACTAKDTTRALSNIERLMTTMATTDGGAQSTQFKQDIATLNARMEPLASLDRVLPLLQIVGLDANNHIQVLDQANGKTENLIVAKDGLLGPDAPMDSSAHHQLYQTPDGQDWHKAIAPKYVSQAKLEDCYFLSGVQALAAKSPETIKDMIHDNGPQADGTHTYTVKFPGAKDHPVTVNEPTVYETTAFAQDSGGLWTNVLEKAHRKLTARGLDDPGDSVVAKNGLALLSPVGTFPVAVAESQIHDTLPLINAKDMIAIGGTKQFDTVTVTDDRGNRVKLMGSHMYSLLSYDEKKETVTIANPWGRNITEKLVNADPYNLKVPTAFDAIYAADLAEPKNLINTGARLTISIRDFKKNFNAFAMAPLTGP